MVWALPDDHAAPVWEPQDEGPFTPQVRRGDGRGHGPTGIKPQHGRVRYKKKNTTLSQIGSASKEKKKHNNNNRKGMNIIKDLIRYSPVPGGAGCSGTAATYEQKKKKTNEDK